MRLSTWRALPALYRMSFCKYTTTAFTCDDYALRKPVQVHSWMLFCMTNCCCCRASSWGARRVHDGKTTETRVNGSPSPPRKGQITTFGIYQHERQITPPLRKALESMYSAEIMPALQASNVLCKRTAVVAKALGVSTPAFKNSFLFMALAANSRLQ